MWLVFAADTAAMYSNGFATTSLLSLPSDPYALAHPQMDGASAAVLSVLPKAAAAIISAATNAEGQLSAAQPQVR